MSVWLSGTLGTNSLTVGPGLPVRVEASRPATKQPQLGQHGPCLEAATWSLLG